MDEWTCVCVYTCSLASPVVVFSYKLAVIHGGKEAAAMLRFTDDGKLVVEHQYSAPNGLAFRGLGYDLQLNEHKVPQHKNVEE
jgi:hypothetical protein